MLSSQASLKPDQKLSAMASCRIAWPMPINVNTCNSEKLMQCHFLSSVDSSPSHFPPVQRLLQDLRSQQPAAQQAAAAGSSRQQQQAALSRKYEREINPAESKLFRVDQSCWWKGFDKKRKHEPSVSEDTTALM